MARGGKFGHGFLSAGITKGVFLNYNGYEPGSNTEDMFNRLALHAVVGGTSSKISGGKFANGAGTAAFQFLFNECSSGGCDEWLGFRTNEKGHLIICITPYGCNKSAHLPKASTLDSVEGVAGMIPAGKGVQLITRMSKTAKRVNPLDGTKYTDKVKDQMQGKDLDHNFPSLIDRQADMAKTRKIIGGDGIERTKVELPGSINGKDGNFSWIIEPDKSINHRQFERFRNK